MVLVSDLLADRGGLFSGLRLLRQRGHDVLVFHVMDDEELDFPFNGPTRFEGLEIPDHLNCNPRALREGYLAALHAFLDEVRRECARTGLRLCSGPHGRAAGCGAGDVFEQAIIGDESPLKGKTREW